jgi:hypothetical protein
MLSSATAIPNLSANSDEGTHTSSSHDDDHDSGSPTHTATDDADSEQQVSSSSADKQKSAIVGGIVGAVCGLILIGGVIVYCLRRRRKQRIRSTPFRTVNTISHTTLPSPVATQEGTDRTDEKDASCCEFLVFRRRHPMFKPCDRTRRSICALDGSGVLVTPPSYLAHSRQDTSTSSAKHNRVGVDTVRRGIETAPNNSAHLRAERSS